MMQLLYYLGISHAIFGFALLLTKRPKHESNIILGVWILLLAVLLAGRLSPVPVITFFKPGLFPIYLCFGPLLFLYIKSLTHEKPSFSKIDLLHFLPYVLVIAHRSSTEPVNFGPGGSFNLNDHGLMINFIYYSLTTISITTYTIIAFKQISDHKNNLQNIYSFHSSKYTLTWLRVITSMFLIIFTMNFLAGYFKMLDSEIGIPDDLHSIGSVFFIIMASFFGVNQPVIFAGKPMSDNNLSTQIDEERKYERSGLSISDAEKIKNKIINHIHEKKPYLNPEYNINILAEELSIPRHHITQVINSNLNKNFYTIINEHRVEEVIVRMSKDDYSNYTLLAIAFDSGFNSKSAFNRIFKEATGKTPSEYKSEIKV